MALVCFLLIFFIIMLCIKDKIQFNETQIETNPQTETVTMDKACEWDKGGRRLGLDRREFMYSDYSPERRSGQKRRNGFDRRSEQR